MIDSCTLHEPGLITLEEAIQRIRHEIEPLTGTEYVSLKKAKGRILNKTLFARTDLPPANNSAMDGYALSSQDFKENKDFSLPLTGTSWAGTPYDKPFKPGQCIRVFTGALLPEGADSVIMQEDVEIIGNLIHFPAHVKSRNFVRKKGCDIQTGKQILAAKKLLSSVDIGLIASAGIYEVNVQRKVNIAFFSTGDELCPSYQSLQPGQIYDSNRYSLFALLERAHINLTDLGVLADHRQDMTEQILVASKHYDLIISTGGASVGDADFIHDILQEHGMVNFWKIAVKPGKPLAFAKIGKSCFFALPGNPVSVVTTLQKILNPAIDALVGIKPRTPLRIQAESLSNLKKEQGRKEFQRGILNQDETGKFYVKSAGQQGSHIMSALSQANCYIVLERNCQGINSGEKVFVEPFSTYLES